MSSNVPAHKQTDPNMKPGQIVNSVPAVSDTTLAQYIRRKQQHEALDSVAAEKKLTFEEWYEKERPYVQNLHRVHEARLIWKAVQENAPSSRPGADK